MRNRLTILALLLCGAAAFAKEPRKEIVLRDAGKVSRVTGASIVGEDIPNPNRTDVNWQLGGTDLGIIWEMAPGKYGLAFGDSYGADFRPCGGGPGPAGDWRSNVLGISGNTDLENGLVFSSMMHSDDDPGRATPLIERELRREFTYIPTGAVELGGVQYVHYMYWEVFHRDLADDFYASFCRSIDGGQSWERCEDSITFAHDSNFGMVTLAKDPKGKWCYMMGAQTGRGYRHTPAHLARFRAGDILNKDAYEFWTGKGWTKGDESAAVPVIEDNFGEASLVYMEKYGLWLVLYTCPGKGIAYRSAQSPEGPWSEARVLINGKGYPGCYGCFVHPLSASSGDGVLYYTLSQWNPYNVFLMKAIINTINTNTK